MDLFITFFKNPFVLGLVGFIAFYIRYSDKITSFFPNPNKNLDRLKESKNLMDSKNTEFNRFVDAEIDYYNFQNATGLMKNENHIKLLSHFNKISNKMSWHDFKKIKEQIKDPNIFSFLGTQRFRIKCKLIILFHGLMMFLLSGLIVYLAFKFDFQYENKNLYMSIPILFFMVLFFEVLLLKKIYKLKILKKYNKIIVENFS